MGEVIALRKRVTREHPTILEFLWGGHDDIELPPDGPIAPADLCADAYLLECARFMRRKGFNDKECIGFLQRKTDQICNQIHFGVTADASIIDRLAHWMRELQE